MLFAPFVQRLPIYRLNRLVQTGCPFFHQSAGTVSDRHSGVVTRIRAVAPNAMWVHCSIHREALAAKSMPTNLKEVLDNAMKMVNFIKIQPLNSRIFSALCNEMGSEHVNVLLHMEVRWLSRGKVLARFFELHSEVKVFFTDHPLSA